MKVLLSGGGTAGHVNPAIAIADIIASHDKNAEIAFVGTSRGIENVLAQKAGYPIYHVEMTGLSRSLSLKNIKTLYYCLTAPAKAKKVLLSFKPDIVIGTGGYVCWPLLSAAASLSIPCAVHESNAVPGKAVQMLAKKADRVYLNFASAADYLPKKDNTLYVGNPMKKQSVSQMPADIRKKLHIPEGTEKIIVSFGGSLGSEPQNENIFHLMQDYTVKHPEVFHIHAAGKNYYQTAQKLFTEMGLDKYSNLRLEEYLYDMPYWERLADLVICRAGAMTVSEMALLGKACILIPSPYVVNNHQYKNAKRLADAQAAVLLEEKGLERQKLAAQTEKLLTEEKEASLLSKNIRAFAVPDANERIWNDICRLVQKKDR